MPNCSKTAHQPSNAEAISKIKDWVTAEDFCALFPNIPEKTLRWQLTSRKSNGLHRHVQVIGKRRYISIQGYAAWIGQHAEVICE